MTLTHPVAPGNARFPASPQRGRNSLPALGPGALFGGCE